MTAQTILRTPHTRASPTEPSSVQKQYANHYTQLSEQVRDSGLLRRRYGYYWAKMSLTVLALGATIAGVVLLGDSWFQLILAGVLAVVFAQLAFIGHDAAHRQIFKSGRANDWAGLIQGTLFGGLSSGWWQNKHSKHHANPNKHSKDPDIAPGVLAFTPYARAERGRLGKLVADRQGWFYFPILLFEGLNLHYQSVRRLFSSAPMKRRGWEIGFLTVRLGGYIATLFLIMSPGKAAAFLAIQLGLYGLYMGGAFTPNHIGMPTVPPNMKIDFLRRQVLMSRNVTGGWFIHFAIGGLNYQIEHHLFPSMPRPNLRHVEPLVRQFCNEHRVAYTENSLFASYGIVVRYLNKVGLVGRDPFGCPLAAQLRAPG
ncbi:MAG: acyl-CoA desaturase [Streptosporangiales bacterium]|nr:acyl-CoA desaturase [Streptosporangiales bacterium]